MPAREFAEWGVLYAQEPFGDLRADLRAGIIASTVASQYSNKPVRTRDFMPFLDAGLSASERARARAPDDGGARNAFDRASAKSPRRVVRRLAPGPPQAKR